MKNALLYVFFAIDDQLMKPETKPVMSRKRTRSRSEDSIITGTRIQPINVVSSCLKMGHTFNLMTDFPQLR